MYTYMYRHTHETYFVDEHEKVRKYSSIYVSVCLVYICIHVYKHIIYIYMYCHTCETYRVGGHGKVRNGNLHVQNTREHMRAHQPHHAQLPRRQERYHLWGIWHVKNDICKRKCISLCFQLEVPRHSRERFTHIYDIYIYMCVHKIMYTFVSDRNDTTCEGVGVSDMRVFACIRAHTCEIYISLYLCTCVRLEWPRFIHMRHHNVADGLDDESHIDMQMPNNIYLHQWSRGYVVLVPKLKLQVY